MKKLLSLTLLLFVCFLVQADNAELNPKIKAVTVYQSGAKITRSTKVNLKDGVSEVVFTGLTTQINASSLQVAINGKPILLSASFSVKQMKDPKLTVRMIEIKDSMQLLNDQLAWINDQLAVYRAEAAVIENNKKLGSQQEGMSVEDLIALADFYRKRQLEIKALIRDLNLDSRAISANTSRLQQELNEATANHINPTGEITLLVESKGSSVADIACSYLVTQAGWTPNYDLRSDGVNTAVKLMFKANVWQNTGIDWKKAKLTLSTGNPNANNSRPVLNPRYVDFQITYSRQSLSGAAKNYEMTNTYTETNDEVAYQPPAYNVTTQVNQITTEYEIDARYDIESSSKQHIVAIKQYELPAKYVYHSVPMLDKGAFLIAKISDWGKYQLLAGNANIFFENMYIGQSHINPNTIADTLAISMGRDEGIKIKRITLEDLTHVRVFGVNKKETMTYEIMVRNTKSVPVDIEVLDQIPLTKNKDIEVKLLDQGGAEYTEDYGKLLWKLRLKPNETKKLVFSYQVKYPKDRIVYGK